MEPEDPTEESIVIDFTSSEEQGDLFESPFLVGEQGDLFERPFLVGIKLVQCQHEMYCLRSVMKILFYDDNDPYNITKMTNLYEKSMNLMVQEVAESNKWYNTIPDHNDTPWYQDKMVYMLDQLSNNCEITFLQRCMDLYDGFEPVQQGGPLLYWIIQHQLMSTSRLAVKRLVQQITHLKILAIPGENVETAVALIRGAYRHVKLIKDPITGVSCLPSDFDKTLTKILKTTTVEEFNAVFGVSADERKAKMYGTTFVHPSVETQLTTAQTVYQDLSNDGTWLVTTKGASAFPATQDIVCWN